MVRAASFLFPVKKEASQWVALLLCASIAALTLLFAAGAEGKTGYVLLAALSVLSTLPIILSWPRLFEVLGLLGLGVLLPISLKFHVVFRQDHFGGAVGYRIAAADLLFAALLLYAATRQPGRVRVHVDTTLLIAFVAYLGLALVSALSGSDTELGLFQISALLQAFALFVFLTNYLTTGTRLRAFLAGLLVGLAIQSGIALVQVHRPGLLRLSFLGAAEEQEHRVVRGRIDLPDVDQGTTVIGGVVTERPTGLLIHPNVLALYLVVAIPVAFAVWISTAGIFSWMAFAVLGLSGVAMYYTLSRSGWAGLIFAILLAAVLCIRQRAIQLPFAKVLILCLLALTAAGGLAANAGRLVDRWTATASEAVDFRVNLNRAALAMLLDHPVTGVGLNNFINHVQTYDESGLSRIKPYPVHNIVLMEFSETGFAGGICFLLLVGSAFRLIWRSHALCADPRTRAFVLIIGSGLLGFFLSDMTNFVYRMPVMTSCLWAHIGVLAAVGRTGGKIWEA